MKNIAYLLVVFFAMVRIIASAQIAGNQSASYVGTIELKKVEPSLASKKKRKMAIPLTEAPQDGRASRNLVIPGKDKQGSDDALAKNAHSLTGKYAGKTPEMVFEVNNTVVSPSDPAIAVGPNHALIVYNTGFIIYDKQGNDLTGSLNVDNIFSNGACCDLTVSYDNVADRWVLTVLFFGASAEIAVSDGPDPVTSNWYVYTAPEVNDYQKLSVWSDGYYLADHTAGNIKVWALEREKMLAGDATASIQGFELPGLVTDGFHGIQVLNVCDDNIPAPGGVTVIFEQDDAWLGADADHIKFWNLDVDWEVPGNSVISTPTVYEVTPFIGVFDGGAYANLTQPDNGEDIDALQAMIMNQAQFRKFPAYNAAVFNFVVDTDGGEGELAGIRWYEFRQDGDGQPWYMHQEGTYTAPEGKHAWMGSMMMDYQGNIGLGYSSMAGPTTPNPSDHRVGAFYTGRYANDPLGTMTIGEELISAGTENIDGFRFGDYAKMDIDPNNDKDFWFITEKKETDVVGVFQLAGDLNNDIGVVSIEAPSSGVLTATESITVTIFNYGLTPVSNFDLTYQIDGGAIITETFTGTIASETNAEYTFATPADLSTEGHTYIIASTTMFAVDEFNDNDGTTTEVTHLFPNDVGVSTINNPSTGSGLGTDESITITISNHGSATQTNIPIFFAVDGGAAIQETYTGSIAQEESAEYTFDATYDFSTLGEYTMVAGTELIGDMNEVNDDFSSTIENFMCTPQSNCAGFADGVTVFQWADQDLLTDCSASGYTDNTDIVFNIVLNDNPFEGSLQMGFAGNYSLWIDFNDDFSFDASEVVAEGDAGEANVDFGFTVDFSGMTNIQGEHLMRLRGGDESSSSGDVNAPCDDVTYGRTNDYTANISGVVGVDENSFANTELVIHYLGGDQIELVVNTKDYYRDMPISVRNSAGQLLAYYTLAYNGVGYTKVIDMSYVAPGVYFVQVGDAHLNIIKRVVID